MSEPLTPDHPLTAILRGAAAAVVGLGLAGLFTLAGAPSPFAAAIPAALFALVYAAWRPSGQALLARLRGDHGSAPAGPLAPALAIDAFLGLGGAYAVFRLATTTVLG